MPKSGPVPEKLTLGAIIFLLGSSGPVELFPESHIADVFVHPALNNELESVELR
uniref:Uncharacterized protein n=1 Tax=Peromyscus leucopus gammaherpesvirus TaxID=3048761 RepID=A0A9Y1YSC2_9GAMA|nr:MAG: hypothetical protein ADFBMEEK_00089 [Peromyscus leucopus gammaherpesvirus]